jgi:hypothetical protein
MWHQVECLEDSLSINVSLVGSSWADLFANSLRQLLWRRSEVFRAPMRVSSLESVRKQADELIPMAIEAVQSFNATSLIPKAMMAPRRRIIRLRSALSDFEENEIKSNVKLTLHPLAVIVPTTKTMPLDDHGIIDEEQEEMNAELDEEGDTRWSIHWNFGTEELGSGARLLIVVPQSVLPALSFIRPSVKFTSKQLPQVPHKGRLLAFLKHWDVLVEEK